MVSTASAVWITSDIALDGSYVVTLDINEDTSRILDRHAAINYALALFETVGQATYDVAILRQMQEKLQLPLESAAQVVLDLRERRGLPTHSATAPLIFEGGVTAKFKPFIVVKVKHGKGRIETLGQWSVEDARNHAFAMLDAVVAADLDSAYYSVLVGRIGIEGPRARNVIDDVANYRV